MQSARIRLLFDSHIDSGSDSMARLQQRLSALQVTKLTKPGLYGDGGGLTLQITPTGVKSWLFRYMVDGQAFGMGLGPTHTVSLAEARKKALDARKLLIDGINPLSAKKQNQIAAALAAAKTMTFDQCAEAYILAHQAGWKNAKHRDQWANTLNTYASPVFGHLPVATIDTGLVVKCLAKIWDSKTEPRVACAGVSSPCWGGPPPAVTAPARILHAGKAIWRTCWRPSAKRAGRRTIRRYRGHALARSCQHCVCVRVCPPEPSSSPSLPPVGRAKYAVLDGPSSILEASSGQSRLRE